MENQSVKIDKIINNKIDNYIYFKKYKTIYISYF